MLEEPYSEKLAHHLAVLQFARIPSNIIDAAKLHILDSLGCVLAGARLQPGRLAYNLAITASAGNATSTLFGTSLRASYLDAVQAMATAAHCGELDDIHGGAATLGSGQYVMAVTALRGKLDLASFEETYLHSDSVRRLMLKVKVSASAELDRHFPKYWPGRVTVTLADGCKHSEEIIAPKGELENPMTRRDVEEKFLGLAMPVVGDEKARAIVVEVQSLNTRESLAPLLELLAAR